MGNNRRLVRSAASNQTLAVLALVSLLAVAGCEPSRSFERSADGKVTYIDEQTDKEKEQARKRIVDGLQRGLDSYRLEIGDTLQVLFSVSREPSDKEYVIAVGDTISIEFFYNSDFNRSVKVGPDGRIASLLTGSIMAVGRTGSDLGKIVGREYRNILADSLLSINVTEFRIVQEPSAEDYVIAVGDEIEIEFLNNSDFNRVAKVRPDGGISLPLAGSITAAGLTAVELAKIVEKEYRQILSDPVATINVTEFRVIQEPTAEDYVISVGDEIEIVFLHNSDFNRILKVRPDGRISSFLTGSILAAGLTAGELDAAIRAEYRKILANPIVTVSVASFTEPLDEFLRTINNSDSERSIEAIVGPDGTVILPLLPPIRADGLAFEELEALIDKAYAAIDIPVIASVLPSQIGAERIFIFGEVVSAGSIGSRRPQTVLMAIAAAGGVTRDGSLNAVKVFYLDEEDKPRVRSVNLLNVLNKLQLEEDMLIPDNSVIYVPPTKLATAGKYVDQILRDILMFNGFNAGISASYIINQEEGGGSTIISNP